MNGGDLKFDAQGATPNDLVETIVRIFQEEEDRNLVYKCRRSALLLRVGATETKFCIVSYELKNENLILRLEPEF